MKRLLRAALALLAGCNAFNDIGNYIDRNSPKSENACPGNEIPWECARKQATCAPIPPVYVCAESAHDTEIGPRFTEGADTRAARFGGGPGITILGCVPYDASNPPPSQPQTAGDGCGGAAPSCGGENEACDESAPTCCPGLNCWGGTCG